MKKQLTIIIVVCVFACCVSSWFAYRRGLTEGFIAGAAPLTYARFYRSLTDLQHLRANQPDAVIDALETDCYSSCLHLMQFNYQKGRSSGDGITALVAYRAQYAKPPQQWSPIEGALEESIKRWRSGADTEMRDDPSEIAAVYRSAIR